MNPPKLLLLDEHTAALDPGTAEKVLNLTSRIVKEHQLTCLMITHNMQSALELGNRILMMDSGDIVLDIKEEEKKGLTVEGLLDKFKVGAGKKLDNDRIPVSYTHLTGGVGAGKSTVLAYLDEKYNAFFIQADEVGHMVMAPGQALALIHI